MANDANFNFYLNRQGPRGQKGEKGDQGFSPSITVNTNTADEYTLLIQNEYNNFVTDNIRPTYDDRGGTYVRVDRDNNVQYFGSADIATTANYGEVKLAQSSDLASTVDVGNSNVITVELLKTWFDGQLADNLVTTTNNVTIQGQKIFATPTRFMDTVRVGNRLMVTQEDTGTITFDSSETGTVIGTKLTSTGDANFSQDVAVDGIATIKGGLNVAGNAVISSPQLGNTTISGDLTTKAGISIQGQDIHLQHTNPTMYLKNMNGVNEIEIFRGLFTAGNPSPADNYLSLGHSQLQLNLTGKAIKANGKDIATADTVEAIQSDLNIAKQDIIEAQGDIDNLQMNKQDKLTAGSGITIDADNVISATGGVLDLPIASSTTLGGIKVGENLTISEDGTLSATSGGTGDVSAAGNNTFTGENTFNGAVNLNGISTAENLTVTGNLTSNGAVNAVSIETTGLRSDDIQTTTNKKYLTEVDVDNQTIQVVDGKISSTTPITYLTRAQYDALATKDANTMYVITDEEGGGGGGSGLEVCDIGMALYVDETKGLRRYLNGQIVDINTNTQAFLNRLQEITTLHPSLLCTEEEWQTAKTMSAFGQVGKFVFNYSGDKIVSVRLPRVVNVQGLFDLQNLGMTVSAGLPNITGTINGPSGINASGAFTVEPVTPLTGGKSSSVREGNTYFNASRSNSIYGKSNTVQPEAIQYPYFIQIATGSETENNIINEIELNNPYSLFDSKYSDHELNNLSWLKSKGQWNNKADYPSAYDKLLKVYNGTETVEGLSVKLSTEEYTDYDFVLNTAEQTFRLPLKNGKENLVGNEYIQISTLPANDTTLTAPANGYYTISVWASATTSRFYMTNLSNNLTVGEAGANLSNVSWNYVMPCKKGDKIQFHYESITIQDGNFYFCPNIGNGTLYFYVGETVQNANLIDAGRIGEQLANKIDSTNTQWAVSACMPDYSAGKNVSPETIHTATVDGYVFAQASSRSGGNGGHVDIYDKNGTLIKSWNYVGAESTPTFGYSAFQCPIPKGYSYKVYGGVDIVIQFYPAKGTEV